MASDIETRQRLLDLLNRKTGSKLISDFSEVLINMVQHEIVNGGKAEACLNILMKSSGKLSHSHKRSILITTDKNLRNAKERKKFLERAIKDKFETQNLEKLKDKIILIVERLKKLPNLFWETNSGENKKQIEELLHEIAILNEYFNDFDEFIEYKKNPYLSEQEIEKLKAFQIHLQKSICILKNTENNLNEILFLLEKKSRNQLKDSDRQYLENKETIRYILQMLDVVISTSGFFNDIGQDNLMGILKKETEYSIQKEKDLIEKLTKFKKQIRAFKTHKSTYNITRIVPDLYVSRKNNVIAFYYQAGEKSGLRVTAGLILEGLLQRNIAVRRVAIGENNLNLPQHALLIPKVDLGNVIKDLKKGNMGLNYKYIEPKILKYYQSEKVSKQLVLLPPYFWTFFSTFCKNFPVPTFLSFGPGSISSEEVSWDYVRDLKKDCHFFTRSPLASEGLRRYGVSASRITFTPNMFNESMIRKVSYLDRDALKMKYIKDKYNENITVFSTIGRISGEKNLQSVFSAMETMLPQMKNAVFIIVGDIFGIESNGIKIILNNLLSNPECKDRVILRDLVDHESALEIAHLSDVTFTVSGREACNTLTIEALALGTLPIVLNSTTFPSLFESLPISVEVLSGQGDVIHSESYFDECGKSQVFTDEDNAIYRVHPSRTYWRIYIPNFEDLKRKIMTAYERSNDKAEMENWRRNAIEYAWHTFSSNVVLNRIAKTIDKG